MSQEIQVSNIKSVAVIGGGPSGISTVYELSRALRDGTTAFAQSSIKQQQQANHNAFHKIVAFERGPGLGGVWCRAVSGENNNDPKVPDFDHVEEGWGKPETIFTKRAISDDLEKELTNSSYETPVVVEDDVKSKEDLVRYQWRSSAAYDGLFTNVTNRYMSFSFDERSEEDLKKLEEKYSHLRVFQSGVDVSKYLERVVKNNDLERYFRYNSNVERVRKLENGKWEVTVNELINEGEKVIDKWYTEQFDAIAIANGKTVPRFPEYVNFREFYQLNKDKVNITHTKSISNPEFIKKSKKILFIGASVSAVDLAQYAFPRDLDSGTIFLSRKSDTASKEWVTNTSHAYGIVNKPQIEKFLPEENSVKFVDGTIESNFDVIVFATGFHTYFPFFENNYLKEHTQLTKFYLNTFSVDDPTIGLVGSPCSIYFFNTSESQAAALAGLWAGYSKLPSSEEQEQWLEGDGKVLLLKHNTKRLIIDPLIRLALEGRLNPLESKGKLDHVRHLGEGLRIVEEVWFKIRDGKVTHEEVLDLP